MNIKHIVLTVAMLCVGCAYFYWDPQNNTQVYRPYASTQKQSIKKPQPKTTKKLLNIGDTLANQGNLKQAVTYYTKAMTKSPRSPQVHLHLGLILAMQGHMSQAITTCINLHRVSPRYFRTFCTLGFLTYQTSLTHMRLQRTIKKRAQLQQIIKHQLVIA